MWLLALAVALGSSAPAPYRVAYEARYVIDDTRAFGMHARPVQMRLWYPANDTGGAPLRALDYLDIPAPEAFADVTAALAARNRAIHAYVVKKYFGSRQDLAPAMAALPMLATREHRQPAGRFPLIVYAGGANISTDENVLLCEFLASHGYVVAAIPTMGDTSVEFTADTRGLETLARDLEVVLAAARQHPAVDPSRIASAGFSFGAAASVLVAMRNPLVHAVVSYDGSIIGTTYAGYLRNSPFYDPGSMHAPLLEVHRRDPATVTYDVVDALRYARRDSFELPNLEHIDFTSLPTLFAAAADDAEQIRYKRAAYSAIAQRTLDFLDATMKNDREAQARVATPLVIEGTAFPPRVRASLPVPPDREQLQTMIERDGIAKASTFVRDLRARDPEAPVLAEASIDALGGALLDAGRPHDALAVLRWNVEAHPGSAAAYDSLADAFQAIGNTGCAAAAYQKLIRAGDASTPAATRRALEEKAAQRLAKMPPPPSWESCLSAN